MSTARLPFIRQTIPSGLKGVGCLLKDGLPFHIRKRCGHKQGSEPDSNFIWIIFKRCGHKLCFNIPVLFKPQ